MVGHDRHGSGFPTSDVKEVVFTRTAPHGMDEPRVLVFTDITE